MRVVSLWFCLTFHAAFCQAAVKAITGVEEGNFVAEQIAARDVLSAPDADGRTFREDDDARQNPAFSYNAFDYLGYLYAWRAPAGDASPGSLGPAPASFAYPRF
ncbi:MAG: hypothetical protein AAFU55_04550 [Pseudomonadota bacterium]